MKRIISILLLLTFLFNVGGYYVIFWALQVRADQELSSRLDADKYDKNETIELKISVTLPYPIQEQGFEKIKGTFEHNGEVFRLVKRKLENDTLYIVCVRDHQSERLRSTFTNYVTLTNALPGTTQKALNFLSKLIKDFSFQESVSILDNNEYALLPNFGEIIASFISPALIIHSPPPKV